MKTAKISLNSIDKVKAFVNEISKFDCDFDLVSRLKIPMMDFASITYLPDTKSKSQSNLLISFTNAFTLSMEFSEILAVK